LDTVVSVYTYQYDGYGNVISETDARGNTTVTTYETSTYTYPHTITYPQTSDVDHIEVYESYDYTVGEPTEFKDRNGQSTYNSYDPFGRLEQTDLPDGGQTLYVYDDNNFPSSVTKRVKEQEDSYIDTVTHFDGLHRKIKTASFGEDQKSIITQWQYDSKGRLEMVSGPFFGDGTSDYPQTLPTEYYFESTTYDLRDRPIQIESPDGQNGSIITEYIHDGLSTKIIDPDGYSKTETKDCLGRTIQVVEHWAEASDSTTQYEYNLADELVRVENALGHESTIVYDTLGRKISMTDPDMGQWSYTYDLNGNLEKQTDAQAETITYDYDKLNRVTSKTYSSGDPTVSYGYDDPEVDNSIGRLTSVSNSTATTEYLAYDSMGRIVEEQKTISGQGAFTTEKAYDLSGKLISHTFPGDGYQIAYQYYSGSNLLEQVSGASDLQEYVYCSDYSPKGKMGTLVHGNGAETSHTYDPLSLRLTQINTTHNDDTLLDRSYQYTPGGDIEEITDDVENITYTYTYDERHRLTSETSSDPSQSMTPAIIELQYDDSEHIHAVSDVAVFGVEKSYSYDSNGNMTAGPDLTDPTNIVDREISYNSDNMPYQISYSDSEITTFDYDGDGKRLMKQSPDGKKTLYIDDNYEVIDGVAHRYIFAGNLRVAMIKGSETYHFHKDHLGSSSVITEQDSSDTELSQYLPYGGQRGTSDISVTDYKFTDQEHDSSTGLYNYDARFYDPVIGRFIMADTVVPEWDNPQSMNRYSYCLNNPLIYIDPSGHTTTGESFDEWGYDAYSSGNYIEAYMWAFGSTAWSFFGMESVSKVYDNAITDRNDLTAWDVGGALIDVGTWGKGGGIVAGAWKYGGKALDWGKGLLKYSDDAIELIGASKNTGTETVQRWMSKAELKATEKTGLLRGGRDGTHYVTDSANSNALRARQRSALQQTPEVKVTLEVPKGKFSPPSKVEPAFNMPGGGMERTATGNIPVKIIKVQ
jgi:RHS repeat-associated protein